MTGGPGADFRCPAAQADRIGPQAIAAAAGSFGSAAGAVLPRLWSPRPVPRNQTQAAAADLRPIEPAGFGEEEARRLLWRAGFGGSPGQVRLLASWGPVRAVDSLLSPAPYERPEEREFSDALMPELSTDQRAAFRRAQQMRDEDTLARFRVQRQQREAEDRQQIRLMQRWWLARMIETPNPLEEKMTLFWHGLLATSHRTIENSWHMLLQNRLFRKHALGNYGELLFQIVRDPAMIAYLDNHRSRKESPNENLARELMELFSLGVGGYTERDIKEGARALTGYTFEGSEFVFREAWHDRGHKEILGRSGNLDGDDFVSAILSRRRCSEYLASRLYAYFVADVPEDLRDAPDASAAIRRMASELRRSRYDVKPVLQRLFLSQHFYERTARDGQIKSPAILVVGAVRSLGVPVRDLGALNEAMSLMGQELFFPPSVKGWEGGRAWINTSTIFIRQNILTFLLTGAGPGGRNPLPEGRGFDPAPLLTAAGGASGGVDHACGGLLRIVLGPPPGGAGRGWGDTDRARSLVEYVQARGGELDRATATGVIALITAMPEHQLC